MTRRIAVATAAAALVAVAGCSTPGPEAASAPAPSASASTSATVSTPTATTSPAPGVPSPGSTDRPATTSGPLSKSSFPTPRQLGAGWRYAVDPGDEEEGYAGNGTPALARNPREVVQTAVPFGCTRRTTLPVPSHALEVDYTLHGTKAIAVRSRFADTSEARAFYRARTADLDACVGRTGGAAIGPLVTAVSTPARDATASDRTPRSDPWRELAVLDRDTVVLLAVQGRDPLTTPQTDRLVRLLRS